MNTEPIDESALVPNASTSSENLKVEDWPSNGVDIKDTMTATGMNWEAMGDEATWPFFNTLPDSPLQVHDNPALTISGEPEPAPGPAITNAVSPPPTSSASVTVIGAQPAQASQPACPEEEWACVYNADLETNPTAAPDDCASLLFSLSPNCPGVRGQYGKHSHGRQYELKGFPVVTVTLKPTRSGGKQTAALVQNYVISHRVVKAKCTFQRSEMDQFVGEWNETAEIFRGSSTLSKFSTKEVSGKGFRKTDFHVEVAVFATSPTGDSRSLRFLYASPPFFVNTRGAKDRAARRAKRHASLAATAALARAQNPVQAVPVTQSRSLDDLPNPATLPALPSATANQPIFQDILPELADIALHVSPTKSKSGVEMLFVGDRDFPPNVAIKFGALTLQPVELIPGQRRVLKLLHIPVYEMASEGVKPMPLMPNHSVPVSVVNIDHSKSTNSVIFTYLEVIASSDNPLKRGRDTDDNDGGDDDDDDVKKRRLSELDSIEQCLRSTYQLMESNNQVMRYINGGPNSGGSTRATHTPPTDTAKASTRSRHDTNMSDSPAGDNSPNNEASDASDTEEPDFNLVTFCFRLARAITARRIDTLKMVSSNIDTVLSRHHDSRISGLDSSGMNLLSIATTRGLPLLARHLVKMGASPFDPNADGSCANDLAEEGFFDAEMSRKGGSEFYGTIGPSLSGTQLSENFANMQVADPTTSKADAGDEAPQMSLKEAAAAAAAAVADMPLTTTVIEEEETQAPFKRSDDMFVRRHTHSQPSCGPAVLPIAKNDSGATGSSSSLYQSPYVMDFCGRDLDTLPEDGSHDGADVKKVVGLSHNRLTDFPSFSHPDAVEMLLLNHNKLSEVPTNVGAFVKLRKLWLQCNMLSSLPSQICELGNLRRLYLHHNKLSELPAEIGKLSHLEKLVVDHNQLVDLPESIGQLRKLQVLTASNNELQHIPETIVNLVRLSEIDLSHNQIEDVPSLETLTHLHTLKLEYNCLSCLPDGISQVRDLGLSHNEIHDLCGISQLTGIRDLNLDYNQLRDVPAEIGALSGTLESMSLEANQLRDAQNLCLVKSLTSLNVTSNQLISLPADIRGMKSLRTLNITGNTLLCEWEVHPELKYPVTVPTLMELAARKIFREGILARIPEGQLDNYLSEEMIEYLSEARRCHVCKGPYFPPLYEPGDQYGVGAINFTFFANVGGTRVPLSYQLCSSECRESLRRGYILVNK